MADVFVSYATEDRERVKPIVDAIQAAGLSVWWDRRIGVGQSFDREIEKQLDTCTCVVVVWSRTSVESDWVRNEAQEGLDRGILAPILVDDVKQPLAFRRVQAARYYTGDDQELEKLLEAISVVTATESTAIAVGTPTPEHQIEALPLSAIAVLPFEDLSPARDLQWLAEGLAEDLIDSLSRIKELRVPAITSTSSLKEQNAGIQQIGERLHVGSIVTGSIRQTSDRIHLAVRWIRAQDQVSIWSARFEHPFEKMLETQQELAGSISEAIRKELGIHDTAEFVSRDRYQTSDIRAWEAFRRGFSLVFTFKPSRMAEGREYLHKALEIDPSYLEARAWLAWSDFDRPDKRNEGSIRVIEQQPTNPTALCALIEDSETQWDFETAELLWRYAIENNPLNNQLTLVGFHVCNCLGNTDEALEVTRRGVRLDPLWPAQHFFLGLAHLNLGDASAAIDPIREAISLRAVIGDVSALALFWAYHYLAIALYLAGSESEAIDALSQCFPDYKKSIAEGGSADGWDGANLSLLKAVEGLPGGQSTQFLKIRMRASVLASIGEREAMYDALTALMLLTAEHELRDRDAMRNTQMITSYLKINAEFQPYWLEPRFQSLRQQLDERIAQSAGVAGYADLLR